MTFDYEEHLNHAARQELQLRDTLVDGLLDTGDDLREKLSATSRWRLLRRHRLTNEIIAVGFELQSIEQGIIHVEGHVKEHMRLMGLVK